MVVMGSEDLACCWTLGSLVCVCVVCACTDVVWEGGQHEGWRS